MNRAHDSVTTSRLLGRGIYDVYEVARLIRRHPETVARWTIDRPHIPALLNAQPDGSFTFVDLISLFVVSELGNRGVTRKDIIRGGEYLSSKLDTERPYAHVDLATAGTGFFAGIDTAWVDAGKRGQGAFESVIYPLLSPIEYGNGGLASVWRPGPLIWINPEIQAGTPCIDRTRVPTSVIWGLLNEGQSWAELADDFSVSPNSIEAAAAYEMSLRKAA